jgi:hypothetical protein
MIEFESSSLVEDVFFLVVNSSMERLLSASIICYLSD